MVFDAIEDELMAEVHATLHLEHSIMSLAADDEGFHKETAAAKSRYTNYGELKLPWLKWTPEKTAADLWKAAQERRKNPEWMAWLEQEQARLDAAAASISQQVNEDLELRKAVREHHEKLKQLKSAHRGRRHGRLSRRR
jgi:hypothetical protein